LIEITENDISIEDVIDSIRTAEAGAVVMFLGTVRAEPELEGLELESYKDMALEKLHELRKLALDKFSIIDLSIIHRIGKITVGEDIVIIVVNAARRTDAFSACKFLIDELKVTAPIWKKELGPGTWVNGEVPKQGKIEIERLSGMVDISSKEIVHRSATAEGYVTLLEPTIESIKSQQIKKGDVLEAAKLAAINAVKQTPMLIPLCHPIPITGVDVNFKFFDTGLKVSCTVKADYKTGVEMEALSGVNCALLTIWDMVKYLEKDEAGQYPTTRIHDIRVIRKEKG